MMKQVNNEQIITVNLNRQEVEYINKIGRENDLTINQIMRQALRIHQLVEYGLIVINPLQELMNND